MQENFEVELLHDAKGIGYRLVYQQSNFNEVYTLQWQKFHVVRLYCNRTRYCHMNSVGKCCVGQYDNVRCLRHM